MNIKPSKKIFTSLLIKGHTNCIKADIKIKKPSAQMISAAHCRYFEVLEKQLLSVLITLEIIHRDYSNI